MSNIAAHTGYSASRACLSTLVFFCLILSNFFGFSGVAYFGAKISFLLLRLGFLVKIGYFSFETFVFVCDRGELLQLGFFSYNFPP